TQLKEVLTMKQTLALLPVLALTAAAASAAPQTIKETLTGYEETPAAISTTGGGKFQARVSNDESRIDWTLTYADLEGAVQQAHLPLGALARTGGTGVFLGRTRGKGPAGTQPCPAPPATISGTIVAADVSPNIPATAAARAQGLNTGEMDELLQAIRAGSTYVNVHSSTWPSGEIRSQIDGNSGHDH